MRVRFPPLPPNQTRRGIRNEVVNTAAVVFAVSTPIGFVMHNDNHAKSMLIQAGPGIYVDEVIRPDGRVVVTIGIAGGRG